MIQVGLKYPVRVGDLLVDKDKCELIGGAWSKLLGVVLSSLGMRIAAGSWELITRMR